MVTKIFFLTAFYNLCSLEAHKASLEELIFEAVQARRLERPEKPHLDAMRRLFGISKSFLLAEWFQDLYSKAISNSNNEFVHKLSLWLDQKPIPHDRFVTIKPWLGTTLLWYLGGMDLPRREFMSLLQKMNILSKGAEQLTFNATITKLRLIKGLHIAE